MKTKKPTISLFIYALNVFFSFFFAIVTFPGLEYTGFTSIGCEGGYCVCYEEGGVHMRIFLINIIPIVVYVIGFPLFVHCIIKKNRSIIMEDQLLRAHDLGATQGENRFAFWVRQRYSRMYYQFKPDKVHWIIIILWRKFMIVLIGGLLRHNPSFQLAIMMLVLFTCYVLHMKNRPYMSTVERLLVIQEHKALCSAGDEIQLTIAAHIKRATDAKQTKRNRLMNRSTQGSSLQNIMDQYSGRKEKGAENYFFNYNTMEAILLACAILVCLCGVMFVSCVLVQYWSNTGPPLFKFCSPRLTCSFFLFFFCRYRENWRCQEMNFHNLLPPHL